ncbi:EAL domain-containing protein [Bordetella sp. FB-8]|uniref:diguanylate cyclase domain-containing protein n=1 Tax=Bordetella sp. FB-8 TaxID=1159870 RepID=UPI0003801613|nr:EAL domain-containing protein [Bordetella sp. FB-8]
MSLLALQDLLSALSSDAPLGKIMDSLCREIERVAPEIVACVLVLDENRLIRPLASPSLPDSYIQALDGIPSTPSVGTCGVAMTYVRPHLTYDIAQDPNWAGFKHLVEPLGLRTCWSHPITRRDGRVLGSLAFYFREATRPSDFHESLVKVSLNLCTLAFEHEEAQHNIQKLAYFDTLTGLPNRAMLRKELKRILTQAQRSASSFALVFLDLDNFKEINDGYGHLAGDEVLCQSSRRLQDCARAQDIVGRLGGDEFLAVICDGDAGQVNAIVQRILSSLHKPMAVTGEQTVIVQVTASLGVSIYPKDGRDIDTLLNNADTAMYKSKNAGKNLASFFQTPATSHTAPPASGEAPVPISATAGDTAVDTRYGPSVYSDMAALSRDVPAVIESVIEKFNNRLSTLQGLKHLINCLSPGELTHLKRQQARNLTELCSPELTEEQHNRMALETGRIHAITGLSREQLVASYDILHTILREHVDIARHSAALAVLARRQIRDLSCQMAAAQALQLSRHKILLKVSDLCWNAENYTDLITRTAELLVDQDGVAGCVFMRPDARGILRAEALAGAEVPGLLARGEILQNKWIEQGKEPMQPDSTVTAWKRGHTERCLNYATDPNVEAWRASVMQAGYRSSISLPLVPLSDRGPAAVLVIYSELPGGFSSLEQDAFFMQIKTLLAFGISKLEAFTGLTASISHATRRRWQDLLRGAGLQMHYQPIINPHTRQVKKVEALARLHDDGKVLAPDAFFPALSSEDFYTIFERGLDQALRQRADWIKQNKIHLDITLNLPTSALGNPRYVEATRQALYLYDCPPRALTLELLETEEISPSIDLLSALGAYKKLGVCLAEDDLGSGYSTLTRLREMPFDFIKIDRSIVRQADKDPYNTLRFIYQLTRLGHSLGKQVIVEGVEDPALLQAVAQLGPNYVQGYAIARPMRAELFTDWLGQWYYEAPLPRVSNDALSRLAEALIWEEGLHVIYKEIPDFSAKSAILDEMYASMLNKSASSPQERVLRTDLVQSARRCGLRGTEYLAARDRMVALLMRDQAQGIAAHSAD